MRLTLEARRDELGLSIPELSSLAGVSDDTLRRLERGEKARRRTIRKLAEALGCPWKALQYLEGGSNETSQG